MKNDKIIKIIDKTLEWSLYLMVFALPFSKSTIEVCASIGAVLLILKKVLTKNFRLPNTPANIPLLLIFITAVLSLYNSQYLVLSLRALVAKNLKFIAIYFIVIETMDNEVKITNFLKMGLISALVVFVDTLIQYFITHVDILHIPNNYPAFKYVLNYNPGSGSIEFFRGYPTGPFPFPNDLAAWLLIVIPPALFISLFDLKRIAYKYSLLAFAILGLYIFVLAKARGAWVGFIASIGSMAFLIRKIAIFLLAAVFLLMLACFIKYPGIVFGISSLQDRNVMWANSIKIFKEHPVIGNGINTFYNEYKKIRRDEWTGKKGSYAHNCYLQMAADTGLLGLGAFLYFAAVVIFGAIASVKNARAPFYRGLILGLTMGITAFLVHSFFDTNLYSLNLASLFWLSMGFLVSVTKVLKIKTS